MKVVSSFVQLFTKILSALSIIVLSSQMALAQTGKDGNVVTIGVILILGALVLGAVAVVGNSMVQVLSVKVGNNTNGKVQDEVLESSKNHVLKKGLDIKLKGESAPEITEFHSSRYAVMPVNFNNIAPIPKMLVEVGQEVKAGQPLFYDKGHPNVNFVAPVSGELVEVKRGPKRSIAQVIILADKEVEFKALNSPNIEEVDRAELREFLKVNGGWPLFKQRPFNILPDVDEEPRDIFISGFDTAPLAGDMAMKINGRFDAMQEGINVLNKLTDGKVYMGLDGRENAAIPAELDRMHGVDIHYFDGPHPAGLVGIQIHHIKPINAGDVVWTIGVQELITLGNMFLKDEYRADRVFNVAGTATEKSGYFQTYSGADLKEILSDELADDSKRVITGNVLNGIAKNEDNAFLDFYKDQVTCIVEGNEYEMFGWIVPQTMRPSASRTYPNFLFKDFKYQVDTNTHGEKRAFVVTGQYESVLPVDTYPQYLFKSILTKHVENMEGLGIYELVEEDVALCEFVCTSKQPLQKILREGLDFMLKEV